MTMKKFSAALTGLAVVLICTTFAWSGNYRDFGDHAFSACRAVSERGGDPANVWVVIARTKPEVVSYIHFVSGEWMADPGQLRQLLVYEAKVLDANYEPTVPLMDLRDDFDFLWMSTVREQYWFKFLWSFLEMDWR